MKEIVEQLKTELKFEVLELECVDEKFINVGIRVPYAIFAETAEKLKLPIPLKTINDMVQFELDYKEQYMPFINRNKHAMIQYLLKEEIDLDR